jgi:hypothetical protein
MLTRLLSSIVLLLGCQRSTAFDHKPGCVTLHLFDTDTSLFRVPASSAFVCISIWLSGLWYTWLFDEDSVEHLFLSYCRSRIFPCMAQHYKGKSTIPWHDISQCLFSELCTKGIDI